MKRPLTSSKKITESEKKVAELTEALQRERADSINLRRRVDEERSQLANFYKAMVVREFLPVIDDLERALNHIPKDLTSHSYIKGIQVLAKKFENLLAGLGVERIKTIGKHFDPHLHEAVHMEDGDGKHEIISEELQAGYKIGDEVVRPAMVKVKKGK